MKLRRSSGQATVEFAIVLLFFFAFLLSLADMARITYSWACLQHAVNEAARYGSLGRLDGAPDRETSISDRVRAICADLGVEPVNVEMDSPSGAGAGEGGDFYRLTARTTVRLGPVSEILTAMAGDHSGAYAVSANTVIRNEPF